MPPTIVFFFFLFLTLNMCVQIFLLLASLSCWSAKKKKRHGIQHLFSGDLLAMLTRLLFPYTISMARIPFRQFYHQKGQTKKFPVNDSIDLRAQQFWTTNPLIDLPYSVDCSPSKHPQSTVIIWCAVKCVWFSIRTDEYVEKCHHVYEFLFYFYLNWLFHINKRNEKKTKKKWKYEAGPIYNHRPHF